MPRRAAKRAEVGVMQSVHRSWLRVIGHQMARETLDRDLRRTGPEKDDGGPDEHYGGSNNVPSIGPRSLEKPEPSDRGRYVDAAVGSIDTASIVRVDQRQ